MRLMSESKVFGSCAAAQRPMYTNRNHSSEAIPGGPVIILISVDNEMSLAASILLPSSSKVVVKRTVNPDALHAVMAARVVKSCP